MSRSNSGVIWIWLVCILGLFTLAITWMALSYPAFFFMDAMRENYNYPPTAETAINILETAISWFLVFFVIGLLLWAIASSIKRPEESYPIIHHFYGGGKQ